MNHKGFLIVFLGCFFTLFLMASEGYAHPEYCPGGTADCVSCHGVPLCTKCPIDPSCGGAPTNFTIDASVAGGGGSISPSGTVSITAGNSQTFTITPATGYQISDVLVDGSSVGPQTSYAFLVVTANHSISASFFVPAGPPPLADFSVTPLTSSEPYIVKFTDLSTNGPTSWHWDFDDGETSNQQNPVHVYRSPGTYAVTLNATNRNGTDTISTSMDATFVPCPNAPVDLGGWRQTSIQSAYDSAANGDVIKIQAMDFSENLVLDANTAVTLSGGYDCNYLINPAATKVPGSLTISNGTLKVQNLVIQSTSIPLDGATLYANNCAGCHQPLAVSSKAGRSAADIQAAINSNLGGMGALSALTADEVQAIADVLPPSQGGNPGPDYSNCTLCHGQPPSGSSSPNIAGAHAPHSALPLVGTDCSICHTGAAHNSQVNFGFASGFDAKSGPATHNLSGTCSNVKCHGGQTTPNWLNGAINVNTDCTSCHVYGSTQYNSYSSGRHNKHVNGEHVGCTSCHNTTTLQNGHFTNLQTTTFEQSPAATVGGGSTRVGSYSGGRCSSIQCHGSERW